MKLLRKKPVRPAMNEDKNVRILRFLEERACCVLATVDPDGNPDASVVYYGIEPDFGLTFLTKRDTKKSGNLHFNNRIVAVIYDEALQATVQVKGVAEEVTEAEKAHDIFRNTLRKSLHAAAAGIPPIAKLSAGTYVAYRIKPTQVAMAVYSRPGIGGYRQTFEFADLS